MLNNVSLCLESAGSACWLIYSQQVLLLSFALGAVCYKFSSCPKLQGSAYCSLAKPRIRVHYLKIYTFVVEEQKSII